MISFPGKGIIQRGLCRTSTEIARISSVFHRADLSVFHEFAPSPAGGGHQFLRALKREWEQMDFRVELNSISASTWGCLFNSFNFDAARLQRLRRAPCRMVHRVDGPLAVYRGFDDGTDRRVAELNRQFADATIFQSQFSLRAHEQLGLLFRSPTVIPNAADPTIFFPHPEKKETAQQKLRIVSASWSDNRNKGADIFEWLDTHLDFSRIEYTFVGRLSVPLRNIRCLEPLPSSALADLLRQQDVYLAASRNDPCSNSLIEAMSCGLPAVFLKSGGHPELVGSAGLGFDTAEEIPALLKTMRDHLPEYCEKIRVPNIMEVAQAYASILKGSA